MKKILISLLTVSLVGGAVYGATSAFFSDTEVSAGNTIEAGSVTLGITNISQSGNVGPVFTFNEGNMNFSFTDLKPLDNGIVTYDLTNGANEAYVCAMVTQTASVDNTVVDPELTLGDNNVTGELGNYLSFKFGSQSGTLQNIGGLWQTVGTISPNSPASSAINYCFGEYDISNNCVLGTGNYNWAQTDGLTANVSFYAEQTRNNPNFNCGDLNTVSNTDLASDLTSAKVDGTWFFYNDLNDTIMPVNQFASAGANEIIEGPMGVGAARMMLDSASSRYNIATYRFNDVKLVDLGNLKYRVYDTDAANPPYLHFNVDFNNSDTWQNRLVQVPTLVQDTWTEVDALAGMWTYSGAFWPAGTSIAAGTIPGTTSMTWSSVLSEYPNAETRSTDSFLGVRVGHPGPVGDEGFVDWIEFDGIRYNFEN